MNFNDDDERLLHYQYEAGKGKVSTNTHTPNKIMAWSKHHDEKCGGIGIGINHHQSIGIHTQASR